MLMEAEKNYEMKVNLKIDVEVNLSIFIIAHVTWLQIYNLIQKKILN